MKFLKFITALALTAAMLTGGWALVRPKYASASVEGTMIQRYYDDPEGHDVIFLGDCEVYETYSPQVLWDEYGITSFVRGSAQQLAWQSYYLLEDTLRIECPEAVVFNVQCLQYDEPVREEYNRMTLDGMQWSRSKLDAIKASMTAEEHLADYVVPLLRYHSRLSKLSGEDFTYAFTDAPNPAYDGYYMRVDVLPATDMGDDRQAPPSLLGPRALSYLERMRKLCELNYIKLVLVKAPSLYPPWYEAWNDEIIAYSDSNDLTYIDFQDEEIREEIGLDYSTDTYDGGLHTNLSGATKVTKYLGSVLADNLGIADRRGDAKLAEKWAGKQARFDAEIQRQTAQMTAEGKTVITADAGRRSGEDSNDIGSEVDVETKDERTAVAVTQAGIVTPPEGYDGYVFQADDNTAVCVGEPIEPILANLGEPARYFEVPSCAFDGLERVRGYDGYEIHTYTEEDGEERVFSIVVTGEDRRTPEGAYVGQSIGEVTVIYGLPEDSIVEDGMNLTYSLTDSSIMFVIEGGKVSYMQYGESI